MVRAIKQESDCDVILGGPHISTLREKVLEECECVDYGVIGEGDQTIVDLCRGKDLESITGLIYRKDNKVVCTRIREPIHDIDSLGFPRYKSFEMEKYFGYGSEIGIVTSRGCPYGCTFCAVNLIMGSRIRLRTAEHVANEFAYWYEKGYRRFVILDDNFSHNRERVFLICDALEVRSIQNIQISLANGLRADKTDSEMLKRLRDVGAYEIQIGVESASDRVLKVIKKGEPLDRIEQAVKESIDVRFEVGTNFLIGSIGETYEDVQASFHFSLKYPLARSYFFNIIPYPGTRLYQQLEELDYMRSTPEEYLGSVQQNQNQPVFETPELSLAQRQKLIRQSQKISEKVRRRFLERKLKRFWIFSKVIAFFAAWHVTEPILKRNKFINTKLLPGYYRLHRNRK